MDNEENPSGDLDETVKLWSEIVIGFIMGVFCIVGVISNAINCRVFIRQGVVSDSSTIGLFALAIADFLGCLSRSCISTCVFIQIFGSPTQQYNCDMLNLAVFASISIMLSRITCWVNVHIAVERSLCVLLPFKVKQLVRPKVTIMSMTIIYVVLFVSYLSEFFHIRLYWGYNDDLNSTALVLWANEHAIRYPKYLSLVFTTILSNAATVIIVISTGLMLYKLHKNKKWREKNSKATIKRDVSSQIQTTNIDSSNGTEDPKSVSGKEAETSQGKRDMEVLKTVLMITICFLVCLLMSHIPGIAIMTYDGVSLFGRNRDLFILIYNYKAMFDCINSAVNFFFYIKVSSRYIKAFDEVFRKSKISK